MESLPFVAVRIRNTCGLSSTLVRLRILFAIYFMELLTLWLRLWSTVELYLERGIDFIDLIVFSWDLDLIA